MLTRFSSSPVHEEIKTDGVSELVEEESVKLRPGNRLVSLDAFRGFIMFWIVDGRGLVVGLQGLGHNRLLDFLVYQLSHSA